MVHNTAVSDTSTDLDVLIIGAGLSGIDAAYRLQSRCPDHRYAIVEAREAVGGTWDLFRYPGIRSDSDMSTLGFPFEPWDSDVRIADGESIRSYIADTAAKYGIDRHIRFGHRVVSADWCSHTARWTVTCRAAEATRTITCKFLHACSGYYDYAAGHTPHFDGTETFGGRIVHPQHWPDDLDVANQRVVAIGSGATAITLVPALVKAGADVTMLQRSPTDVVTMPRLDGLATRLRGWLPKRLVGTLVRWKNILISLYFYRYARSKPAATRRQLLKFAQNQLGPKVDAATHFNPRYQPWDQRLCVAPDGDLFRALRKGQAAVVTDTVERFTPTGIRTGSGEDLPADIIVTATGLTVQLFGGAQVTIDGRDIDPASRTIYRGMMLDGVPNFAFAFGYTNASWTLKCDLTAQLVCRVLRRMRKTGAAVCMPVRGDAVEPEVMVDLNAGYIQRAKHLMPQQGARTPWRVYQNYLLDLATTRFVRLDDGVLQFSNSGQPAGALPEARAKAA